MKSIFVAIFVCVFLFPSDVFCRVSQNRIIPFKPSGKITIKLRDGSIINGISNAVMGLPFMVNQDKEFFPIEITEIEKLNFYYDEENRVNTVKGSLADGRIIDAVFFSSTKYISVIQPERILNILLDHCSSIEIEKGAIPPHIEMRYAYIEAVDGTVIEIPEQIIMYQYTYFWKENNIPSTNYYTGILGYGDIRLDMLGMKYLRFCTENEKFGNGDNSILVNVHKRDNTVFSTYLPCTEKYEAYIMTGINKEAFLPLKNKKIKGIHFGKYDPDFANSVENISWKLPEQDVFKFKGSAVIHLNDNTKFTVPANTLGFMDYPQIRSYIVNSENIHINKYQTAYIYFESLKEIDFTDSSNEWNAIIELTTDSGEKTYMESFNSNSLYAFHDNTYKRFEVGEISKIEIDMNKTPTASTLPNDIKITDMNGTVFFTPDFALTFILTNGSYNGPANELSREVKISDGRSFSYPEIEKIIFTPEENKRNQIRLYLRNGVSLLTQLDISDYYLSWLEFLTQQGVYHLSLLDEVKSIEFLYK